MYSSLIIRKEILIQILCIPILVITLSGCQEKQEVPQKQSQAIELIKNDITYAKAGQLLQRTAFTGTVQAVQQTTIQSQTAATILKINVDVGQSVKRGQILLYLNNQDNIARLAQAQADLNSAQAQANLNHSLVERKKRLFQQGFISQLELEQSQVEYQAQQETVKAQKATVNIAQKAAQDATIISPISGYITKRQVNAGQSVAIGETLFEIVDPSQLEIKASLSSSEQYKTHIGQTIQFKIQGNKQEFQAEISRISPIADPLSRSFEFFAKPINASKHLSIGAFIDGHIVQSTTQEGLLLPLVSIQNLHQQPFVWVIRDQKIYKVQINILEIDPKQEIALITGINDHDMVSLVKFNPQDQNRLVHVAP